jgi:hypothetical protein
MRSLIIGLLVLLPTLGANGAVVKIDENTPLSFSFDVSGASSFQTGSFRLGVVSDDLSVVEGMLYDFGSSPGADDVVKAQFFNIFSSDIDNAGGAIFRVLGNNNAVIPSVDISGISTLFLKWFAAPGSAFEFNTEGGTISIRTDMGPIPGILSVAEVPAPGSLGLLGLGLAALGLVRRKRA